MSLSLVIALRRIAEVGIQITMPGERIHTAACGLFRSPRRSGRALVRVQGLRAGARRSEHEVRVLFPPLSEGAVFRAACVMADSAVGEFSEWSDEYRRDDG